MPSFAFISGLVLGAAAGALAVWINGVYAAQATYGTCLQTYPNIPGKLLLEKR